MRRHAAIAVTVVLAACLSEVISPAPEPSISSTTVSANPDNVLSAILRLRVRHADSVAVRYGLAAVLDSITPPQRVTGDSVIVPVLGLLPETPYNFQAVAYGGGRQARGAVLGLTTGALPADLPRYAAVGSSPTAGYIAFSAGRYGIVIDNTARVVWYHQFPNGAGLNFQPQPTGRYVARPPTPANGPWIEVDPLGQVTRTFGCARGLVARFHDLILEPSGGYWVLCDETRTMDLSSEGGVASAQVTGTVVQHISAMGSLLFEWSAFDYFAITDLPLADRTGASVNWTHANALDLDTDGNLVVSFRSLSEITKINTGTGAVMWRMGGLRNEFTFLGAAATGFARQHGLRVTGAGRLTLLDNLGDPAGSRAERYVVDAAMHTARLVRSYGPVPAVTALLGGTTQTLPGGRTLVAFGNGDRLQEYDSTGAVMWEIVGSAGYVFRAERIWSLYFPGVGSPR